MFIVGLSSGKAEGHRAMALVETFGEYRVNKRYNLRRVERFKIKSDDDVADRIIEVLDNDHLRGNTDLVVDITISGQKLIDSLSKAKLNPIAVSIIDEDSETGDNMFYAVPKKKLITNLQLLYVAERFRVNPRSALAEVLIEEIMRFRAHETPKSQEIYKTRIVQDYDDIVYAVALACWYGLPRT